MSHRAGRQSGRRALEQDPRQHLPDSEGVGPGVLRGGQHKDFRVVVAARGAALVERVDGESAVHVDPAIVGLGHQSAFGDTVEFSGRRCPPIQFVVVVVVVAAQGFSQPGRLNQARPRVRAQHVEGDGVISPRVAQHRFQRRPVLGRPERQPVRPATQYRVGKVAASPGDVLGGHDVDRGEVVEVVRVRKLRDVAAPAGRGHRDPEVVQCGATADDRLATGFVGRFHCSARIDEQIDAGAAGDPPPGLAVVQRRGMARQFDCRRDHLGIRGHLHHHCHLPVR